MAKGVDGVVRPLDEYVCDIRRKKIPPHERVRTTAAFIARQESYVDSFFMESAEGDLYYFDKRESHLVPMCAPRFGYMLAERYGLIPAESFTKQVTSRLEAVAHYNPHHPQVKRFSTYIKGILYLSLYNGKCLRLDGKTITTIPNGKECFFIDDDGGVPPPDKLDFADHGLLRDQFVNDLNFTKKTEGGLTPELQQVLLTVWMYAIAFEEILPTKPVLILEGDKGSGKTLFGKRIQYLTFGDTKIDPLSKHHKADALATIFLRNRIALLDNVDSFVDWLPDALASYLTGGRFAKRKLYSDNEESVVRPQSFPVVTTRNPVSFYRDDIADRALIVRLENRASIGFTSEGSLFGAIQKNRAKLYGEWVFNLNRIVATLKKTTDRYNSETRLADFARLAHVIGDAVNVKNVKEALTTMQHERNMWIGEHDSLFDVIDWVVKHRNALSGTAAEIYKQLQTEELNAGVQLHFKSVKQLALQLRQKWSGIEERYTANRYGDRGNIQYSIERRLH